MADIARSPPSGLAVSRALGRIADSLGGKGRPTHVHLGSMFRAKFDLWSLRPAGSAMVDPLGGRRRDGVGHWRLNSPVQAELLDGECHCNDIIREPVR